MTDSLAGGVSTCHCLAALDHYSRWSRPLWTTLAVYKYLSLQKRITMTKHTSVQFRDKMFRNVFEHCRVDRKDPL